MTQTETKPTGLAGVPPDYRSQLADRVDGDTFNAPAIEKFAEAVPSTETSTRGRSGLLTSLARFLAPAPVAMVLKTSEFPAVSSLPSLIPSGTALVVTAAPTINVTAPHEEAYAAAWSVHQAFEDARRFAGDEHGEGYDIFAARIENLLREYTRPAFEAVRDLALLSGVDSRLGLSALRAAGHVRASQETRRSLAMDALRSTLPELRYGALHILAGLNDRSTLATLTEASRRERIAALRADMERLIELLVQD